MIEHLRLTRGDRFGQINDESLRRFVRLGMDQAAAIGVQDLPGFATFLELIAEFGQDFLETQEWSRKALAATSSMDGARKLDALLRAAMEDYDTKERLQAAQLEARELAAAVPEEPPPAGEEADQVDASDTGETDLEVQ